MTSRRTVPHRVIQWGTGNTGAHTVRFLLEDPAFDVVGVWANREENVGRTAGEPLIMSSIEELQYCKHTIEQRRLKPVGARWRRGIVIRHSSHRRCCRVEIAYPLG